MTRLAVAGAIAVTLAARALALGPPVPPLTGPVVDQANIIDPANRQRIDALARDLERRTGAEMAVLTMQSVAPLTAFDYGMQVVDTWKLGKKGRDDGLLMLVVLDPREVRIFPGYGLEGTLPDGRVGAILDDFVVPQFKRGAHGDGIYAGLSAAAAAITGDAAPRAPPRPQQGVPAWLVIALFVGLILFLLLFSDAGGPPGGSARRRGGYPSLPYGGPFPGPRFPGGWGGGFGGGGFGSGGGGFGGGGAGRSW